jgi:hypothetical protein
MAESDKIPQIDPTEIEILIEKFEQNKRIPSANVFDNEF